jgi:hypothetical protein
MGEGVKDRPCNHPPARSIVEVVGEKMPQLAWDSATGVVGATLAPKKPRRFWIMKTTTALMALAFAAFVAGPAAAQDPAVPQDKAAVQEKAPEKAAKTQTAMGELVKVDSEKMTLSVRQADGAELTFSYNDQTEISGEQKNAQGLATAEGSKVVVHYTATDTAKTATKIEIKPAKK